MKLTIDQCVHDRSVGLKIVDDIDNKRAAHYERIGYGLKVDVTARVRAREIARIAAIDAFLQSVGD
ncbi:MAG: hypothetical protein R3C08_14385 [Hyphomonas sp.]